MDLESIQLKPEPINLVIYHDKCTDGLTAASVFDYVCSQRLTFPTIIYLPYTIERGFPLSKVLALNADENSIIGTIYLVDCAPPNVETLEALNKLKVSVVILDHHKSNIEMLEQNTHLYNTKLSVLDNSRSGAGIAWDYFFPFKRNNMIDLVEDRDLWNYHHADTKAFFYGLGTLDTEIRTYSKLLGSPEDIFNVVQTGKAIESYVDHRVDTTAKTNLKYAYIDSKRCVLVNATENISDVCNRLLELNPTVEVAIGYYHIPERNEFKVSMRSRREDNVDVSAICKKFNKGGGHMNAAACVMDSLTFMEALKD